MHKKALEPDPDLQTYGPVMKEKVRQCISLSRVLIGSTFHVVLSLSVAVYVAFYVTPSAADCVLHLSVLSCGAAVCATVRIVVRVAMRVAVHVVLTKIREQVLKLHEHYLLLPITHCNTHCNTYSLDDSSETSAQIS